MGLAGAILAASALFSWTATQTAGLGDPALARALTTLSFATGGIGFVAPFGLLRQIHPPQRRGLFANPSPGGTRRFRTPACHQAAYRRRRADAPEDTPTQHRGGRSPNLTPRNTN
jgi:hypothetical protein